MRPAQTSALQMLGADPERRARMAFARLTEPTNTIAQEEVRRIGHVQAFEQLVAGHGPLSAAAARRLESLDLDAEERAVLRCHARLLMPGDDEWPAGLNDLEHPPHCIWVRGGGHLARLAERAVAIVGARSATGYGTHVASELAFGLSQRGMTVVSGAAYGIDAAAHRGALAAGAPTVAALACGIDRAYPAAHTDLIEAIAADGVVLTDVPPGSAPLRARFLSRNRLIAALGLGTVVVEAGLRSGSLNTAGWAETLARPVGAVPGPVTSPVSAGTNERLRQHSAEVVTDVADVLELVGRFGLDLAPEKRGVAVAEDVYTPTQSAVWEALSQRRSRSADRLAADAGLAVAQVHGALAELEVLGGAVADDDGWRRR